MKILFHICCSNCALYPVRLVRSEGHEFTGYWYNPNIHPLEEHGLRLDSLRTLSHQLNMSMIYEEKYEDGLFFDLFPPGNIPPSPQRCRSCYRLRLEKTVATAKHEGFDAFSTTLLISPYQDFQQIINTGKELADKYDVRFYEKDFRPYFRDAQGLTRELGLYRQKYCGCIYSKQEREQAIRAKELSRGIQKD